MCVAYISLLNYRIISSTPLSHTDLRHVHTTIDLDTHARESVFFLLLFSTRRSNQKWQTTRRFPFQCIHTPLCPLSRQLLNISATTVSTQSNVCLGSNQHINEFECEHVLVCEKLAITHRSDDFDVFVCIENKIKHFRIQHYLHQFRLIKMRKGE